MKNENGFAAYHHSFSSILSYLIIKENYAPLLSYPESFENFCFSENILQLKFTELD
jgi:hypothetical protein